MVLRCSKNGKRIICALFTIKFNFVLFHISLAFIFILNTRSGESFAEMIFKITVKGIAFSSMIILLAVVQHAKKYTKNS